MKRSFWFGPGAWLLLVGPLRAQSLAGSWQGVETDTHRRGAHWPTELRVQKSQGDNLFGVLYQEEGGNPGASVTFQMRGARAANGSGMQLAHGRKLSETGRSFLSYWCYGAIAFAYDEREEKLTGHATYAPVGDCNTGTYTFYRVKLKSAATVPAGALSTVRVSGRDVQWFADADLKQPLATGNTYRTRLRKPTTFYLKQGYYPTEQSAVVPVTVGIAGAPAAPAPTHPPERTPPVAAVPAPALPPPAPPDTLRPAPTVPVPVPPAPVVLPTVLFQVGKAKLLPLARPALSQLAADLKAQPARRVRVLGHTDRVGEPDKNQALSEQRAAAVKDYLVRAGVAAERIATTGYGDTRPLYPSPDARNRRVEVEEVP
ncbi:MAG: OmpA family protein [Janthinobacterium lividum]